MPTQAQLKAAKQLRRRKRLLQEIRRQQVRQKHDVSRGTYKFEPQPLIKLTLWQRLKNWIYRS